MNEELLEQITKLKELAIQPHYYCEDDYYSCPKHEDGCANDSSGSECDCGAEENNAEVEELFKEIVKQLD